ncbi:MAG: EAL domain-containing protein [Campylobacterales bacterium]|nr:EAL domain-containing protein [Campylobacterales bacterium]
MDKIFIGRQAILNKHGKVFGYELLYRDGEGEIQHFPSNMGATARVLLNALTHLQLKDVIGKDKYAFLNIDHTIIEAEFLDLLDPKYFVLEILETTEVTDEFLQGVLKLRKKGFKFAIDDFDCTQEMIKKFSKVFKLVNIVKIDTKHTTGKRVASVTKQLHGLGIKVLAEKIESREEYSEYLSAGCDFFQGYYLKKTEIVEAFNPCETATLTVLNVIKMLDGDSTVDDIEKHMKTNPDLSYDLLKYLNSPFNGLGQKISSIHQAINLLGRNNFKRWLLIYLYAETGDKEISKNVVDTVIARAEAMEATKTVKKERDQAYLTGMLSMLDTLFGVELEVLFKKLKVDDEIYNAVINGKGELGVTLRKIKGHERSYIKELFLENFDKFETKNLITLLEDANVKNFGSMVNK